MRHRYFAAVFFQTLPIIAYAEVQPLAQTVTWRVFLGAAVALISIGRGGQETVLIESAAQREVERLRNTSN